MKAKVKQDGQLLEFMLETIGTASPNKIRKMIKQGRVTVSGKIITRPDHPVKPGQLVELGKERQAIKLKKAPKPDGAPEIVFEDKFLIAVVKPAGKLTAGKSAPNRPTLLKELSTWLSIRDNQAIRLHAVQRLDRAVSGISLFAKSEDALKKIKRNWQQAEKRYVALVHGSLADEKGVLAGWLERKRAHSVLQSKPNPNAEMVRTNYKNLKPFRNYTLIELRPETEEKHQMRLQLSQAGFPVVGDLKYGPSDDPLRRLALHLHFLEFIHPGTWKPMKLTTPYPSEFSRLGKNTGRL
ncbi:MAG: RluA family pseudouridine synthase [Bacteroidota bacterium]